MPNFKANYLGYVMTASLVLCGCAEQGTESVATKPSLGVTLISPIDPQALAIQNVVSFDVYIDRQTVHVRTVRFSSDASQAHQFGSSKFITP